jgi:hypothetical protein
MNKVITIPALFRAEDRKTQNTLPKKSNLEDVRRLTMLIDKKMQDWSERSSILYICKLRMRFPILFFAKKRARPGYYYNNCGLDDPESGHD